MDPRQQNGKPRPRGLASGTGLNLKGMPVLEIIVNSKRFQNRLKPESPFQAAGGGGQTEFEFNLLLTPPPAAVMLLQGPSAHTASTCATPTGTIGRCTLKRTSSRTSRGGDADVAAGVAEVSAHLESSSR